MPTADALYPPPAFYFSVEVDGGSGMDTSFQEVSGITSQIETEAYVEGGESGFVHALPKGVKHPNLVLKRGLGDASSSLVEWCQKVFEGGMASAIETRDVRVKLLNADGDPLQTWSFTNAFPVKWAIDAFNSTKNEVAIETIELSYTYSNRVS